MIIRTIRYGLLPDDVFIWSIDSREESGGWMILPRRDDVVVLLGQEFWVERVSFDADQQLANVMLKKRIKS